MDNIIVGISGATGAILGIQLIDRLKEANKTVHLIMSDWAIKNFDIETDVGIEDVIKKVDYYHDNRNLGATISSGSHPVSAMVIVPCSMKTLSSIANGYAENLISRCADVTLKEGRKLVLVPRETPLNAIHLENMLKLSRLGVTIMPPMPAFYNKPEGLGAMINNFTGRLLDQLNIKCGFVDRWEGMPTNRSG